MGVTKILMQLTSFLGIIYFSAGAMSEHKKTGPMFGRNNKFIIFVVPCITLCSKNNSEMQQLRFILRKCFYSTCFE